MKGLLIKDFIQCRSYFKQLLLIFAFCSLFSIITKSISYNLMICLMFTSMTFMTSMSFDEQYKWNQLALSTSITRKELVLSKYVFWILLCITGYLLASLIGGFLTIALHNDIPEFILSTSLSAMIFFSFFSILIPIMFQYGTQKARFILMAIFLIPSVIGFLLYQSLKYMGISSAMIGDILTNIITNYFWMFPLVFVAILFLTYFVSVRIVEKKEW